MQFTLVETSQLQGSSTAIAVGNYLCSRFRRLTIILSGLTVETVQLQVSTDGGVTYSAALGMVPIAGGALVANMTNGTYLAGPDSSGLLPACTNFRLVKSAAVETLAYKIALST